MKRNVLTLVVAGAFALGGFAIVQAGPGHRGHWHGHGFGVERMIEKLDLTADQQTKADPIIEAAKPQITAIHEEAMQKMKTAAEIRRHTEGASRHDERPQRASRRDPGLISILRN